MVNKLSVKAKVREIIKDRELSGNIDRAMSRMNALDMSLRRLGKSELRRFVFEGKKLLR